MHIGIVACSFEGAALCYRTIGLEAEAVMGEHNHPEITMHSIPMAEYMPPLETGDLKAVADLILRSAKVVAAAGAEFFICPDNTCHLAYELVAERAPIPWLSIAEVVADEAVRRGFRKLALLGTRFTMEGPVYPAVLARLGIGVATPDAAERAEIDRVIFSELVKGEFKEDARLYYNGVIARLREAEACDAAILGCTEIPLLVRADDCPLPVLDSTRLLARAAIKRAIGEQGPGAGSRGPG
jgi:aspartate racemase